MSNTFSITLVGLQPDGGRADAEFGKCNVRAMPAEDLQQLLERFRLVDPIELVTAEPEIIIEHRRSKFVIKAGEGKLYLEDRSKFDDPTLALTSAEILAEVDGSAKAERSRRMAEVKNREAAALAELKQNQPEAAPVVPRPPSVLGSKQRGALIGIALCLVSYLAVSLWAAASGDSPSFEPFTDEKEIARARAEIVGVYMTGAQPGDHGITLTADGKVRFFTVNAKTPPNQIHETYRLGRSEGQLGLLTGQPGGMIRVTAPDTLTFCQESYQRIR